MKEIRKIIIKLTLGQWWGNIVDLLGSIVAAVSEQAQNGILGTAQFLSQVLLQQVVQRWLDGRHRLHQSLPEAIVVLGVRDHSARDQDRRQNHQQFAEAGFTGWLELAQRSTRVDRQDGPLLRGGDVRGEWSEIVFLASSGRDSERGIM